MPASIKCKYGNKIISIEEALEIRKNNKSEVFNCIECGLKVKPHSEGGHTSSHFEHIRRNAKCSLSHNP